MRVLVTEDQIGASRDAVACLEAAGHEVVRCQPAGGSVRPCVGLGGGECPLTTAVDVAVAIRVGPGAGETSPAELSATDLSAAAISAELSGELVMRELGIVCAGRVGAPLVSVGSHGSNPLPGYPRALPGYVVETVERVAAGGTRPSVRELAAAARHALSGTRDALSMGQSVEVAYIDGPTSYDVMARLPGTASQYGRDVVEARLREAITTDGNRHAIALRDIVATAGASSGQE